MEKFVVSARKYRPQDFSSVVGQSHITTTLKNAIKSAHLAQAFLFCGPRGVGKTTCARILAKTINCENLNPEGEACGVCKSCVAFDNSASFNTYELDAASNNSVDDIRSLVEQVRYAPQAGRYKVYIIDEVHMLSNAAFNAFLKTLEEPPSYAIFILATTEKHKILPTILSRCQIFDFNRISITDMASHLAQIATKENIVAEPAALRLIAQKADGGLRDALSMFDLIHTFSGNQAISYAQTIENLHILDYDYYFKLTDTFLASDLSAALLIFDQILRKGFDGHNFVDGLGMHIRALMMCKSPQTSVLIDADEQTLSRYETQASQSDKSFLLSALSLIGQADIQYKNSKNARLLVEILLIKLTHLNQALYPAALINPPPVSAAQPTKQAIPAPVAASQALPTAEPEEKKKSEPELKPVSKAEPKISNNAILTIEQAIENWKVQIENNPDESVKGLWRTFEYLIDNQCIIVQVPSDFASQKALEHIQILKEFAQLNTQNTLIQIQTRIKVPQNTAYIYTASQKFERLIEKYPDLNLLTDMLGLEPELS